MTIEQLLEIDDPDYLDKMTNAELLSHFERYLKVTRPDLAEKPTRKESSYSSPKPVNKKLESAKDKVAAKMRELGLDPSILKR